MYKSNTNAKDNIDKDELENHTISENDLKYYKKDIDYKKLTPSSKKLFDKYRNVDTESVQFRLNEQKKIKENNEEEYLDLALLNLSIIPCVFETSLKFLFISDNNLITLGNLSNLVNLKALDCSNNKLTSLNNLPKNLTELICSHNNLNTLDCSYLPYLQILDCGYNEMSFLNYGNNLKMLECENNKLTTLHPTKSTTTLITLHCHNNFLTTLPNYKILKFLNCSKNQITKLCDYKMLEELYCDNNKISNLSNLPSIQIISCNHNSGITLPYFDKLQEISIDIENSCISSKYKILATYKSKTTILIFFQFD